MGMALTPDRRTTIVDVALPALSISRRTARDVALVVAGAGLTAVAAQLYVPLWPVPVTGQTLAVLLVGVSLGALRGASALALYALAGAVGLPVFSESSSGIAVIVGPTGGYIVGFILAAGLTGWLAHYRWDRRLLGALAAFSLGTAVPFLIGLPWLAVYLNGVGLPSDLGAVVASGLLPFIPGGIVKALLGALIISSAWWLLERRNREAGVQN